MDTFLTIVITAFAAGAAGVWLGYGRGCIVGVESVMLGFESVIAEHTGKKHSKHMRVPDENGLELGRNLGKRYREAISRIPDVTS